MLTTALGAPAPRVRAARRRRTRAGALLTLLAALLGLMLAGAGGASAHAALLSSDPKQGSVLSTAPTQVVLHFSEQVTLAGDAMRVFDPSGRRVDSGSAGHSGNDDSTARVALAPKLAEGTYTVAWRAVSADTHPVSGAFTFSYGHASSTTAVSGEQATRGSALVGILYGASRTIQYGAAALLIGPVVLVLLCWPAGVRQRSVQRLMLGGWAGLLLATMAQLLLRGPYEAATGLSSGFALNVVQRTLGEHLGTLLVVRILLLAAAGVFLSLLAGQTGVGLPGAEEADPGAERRLRATLGITGAVLAIALACTWALADHASVGIQVDLAVPLDVIHILAMCCWLGGLTTMLLGLRRPVAEGGVGIASVERFSLLAQCSVTALVGTGVYQAWRGLGSWGALLNTDYGRLLLVKIGAVLVILAAAWMSRRWTALLRAEPGAPAEGVAEASADTAAPARPLDPAEAEGPAEAVAVAPAQAVTGTEVPADPVVPAEAGRSAEAEDPAGTDSEAAAEAEAETEAEPDPVRAAQLRRQQAARRTAATARAREASPARGMLLRSVLLEVTFAIIVLVVTTLLTNAPPGRSVTAQNRAGSGGATAGATTGPVDLNLSFDTGGPGNNAKGKVSIDIDPARVGQNVLHAYVYDSAGKPVDEPELDITLSLPAKNLGPLTATLDKVDAGHWAAPALQLPMAGQWQLSVIIRSDAIDETTVTAPMQVSN